MSARIIDGKAVAQRVRDRVRDDVAALHDQGVRPGLATIIVGAVAFIHSIPAGIAIVVYAVVYQQVENHLLQPLIYGRAVQLSPLAVLIAVLIGASIAGILGALAAIPVAGAIQILIIDWRRSRLARIVDEPVAGIPPAAPAD